MSRPQTPGYTVRRPPINTALNAATSGISRATTPAKNVITLEEWERQTALSDSQLQSISLVKERLSERPLPEKVAPAHSA